MARNWDYAEHTRLVKRLGGPKNAVRKIHSAGRMQGRIDMGSAFLGVASVYGLYKLYEHHKNADITKTKNTNEDHKMTLKEAYTKVKKDYNDWDFGDILEFDDFYFFCGRPQGAKGDIILEVPIFSKITNSIELIDTLEVLNKKEIRTIHPEEL